VGYNFRAFAFGFDDELEKIAMGMAAPIPPKPGQVSSMIQPKALAPKTMSNNAASSQANYTKVNSAVAGTDIGGALPQKTQAPPPIS
jgi:hypothetical protein